MQKWEIIPFSRFGDLCFGSSRADVRSLLGQNFQSFRKTPKSISETDEYRSLGLHLYYEENDKLRFVEAFLPCVPTYRQLSFLPKSRTDTVIEFAVQVGVAVRSVPSGFAFDEIGVSLYVPYGDTIDCVGIYGKSEYELALKLWAEIVEKRRLREAQRRATGPIPDPFGFETN